MPQSDNHSYNVPDHGDPDWHVPLNDNFRAFDTDIELRDTDANRAGYTPKDGAKFLATDTGVVWLGDGTDWQPVLALPRWSPPASSGHTGNIVAGHTSNSVAAGTSGATIAGGGFDDGATAIPNEVTGDLGTIGGGYGNTAARRGTVAGGTTNGATGSSCTVGGGDSNSASGRTATIAGGNSNVADGDWAVVSGGRANDASGERSTIGGGRTNEASDTSATVAGGTSNTASAASTTVAGGRANRATGVNATVSGGGVNEASAGNAVVGGGRTNVASSDWATVSGGNGNEAGGTSSTVAGGRSNVASGLFDVVGGGEENQATGNRATVPGGASNVADGDYSFAAGRLAAANGQTGAFVWGDGSDRVVEAGAANQFVVQAGGGVTLYSDSDTASATGVELPAGSGSWSSLSSRDAKTNVVPVDPERVLDGVVGMRVSTWEYVGETTVRHMGPMAEDFHDAFGLGPDEHRISTVDADGVALAAIQGLAEKLDARDDALADHESTISEQRERIDDLESTVAPLQAALDDLRNDHDDERANDHDDERANDHDDERAAGATDPATTRSD